MPARRRIAARVRGAPAGEHRSAPSSGSPTRPTAAPGSRRSASSNSTNQRTGTCHALCEHRRNERGVLAAEPGQLARRAPRVHVRHQRLAAVLLLGRLAGRHHARERLQVRPPRAHEQPAVLAPDVRVVLSWPPGRDRACAGRREPAGTAAARAAERPPRRCSAPIARGRRPAGPPAAGTRAGRRRAPWPHHRNAPRTDCKTGARAHARVVCPARSGYAPHWCPSSSSWARNSRRSCSSTTRRPASAPSSPSTRPCWGPRSAARASTRSPATTTRSPTCCAWPAA